LCESSLSTHQCQEHSLERSELGGHRRRDPTAEIALTVRCAIWPDTPDGPFVIELFTSPERRRFHLAANLLHEVLIVAVAAGETTVGLRVRSDNTPALALYRSQGFDLFASRAPLDE